MASRDVAHRHIRVALDRFSDELASDAIRIRFPGGVDVEDDELTQPREASPELVGQERRPSNSVGLKDRDDIGGTAVTCGRDGRGQLPR